MRPSGTSRTTSTTPAERRRQWVRQELQETSNLATLLSCHATQPRPCAAISSFHNRKERGSVDTSSPSFPTTMQQFQSLHSMIQWILHPSRTTSTTSTTATAASTATAMDSHHQQDKPSDSLYRQQFYSILQQDSQTPYYWIPKPFLLQQEQLQDSQDVTYPNLKAWPCIVTDNSNLFQPQQQQQLQLIHLTTPLCIHLAAQVGNTIAWQCLYEDSKQRQPQIEETNKDGNRFIMSLGNPQHGYTPLHLAILYGHAELVRIICTTDPGSCQILDAAGNLPLHLAMMPASSTVPSCSFFAATVADAPSMYCKDDSKDDNDNDNDDNNNNNSNNDKQHNNNNNNNNNIISSIIIIIIIQ